MFSEKIFNKNSISNYLLSKLDLIKILDYSSFEDIFIKVLNTHATKTKIIRANLQELMTKAFWEAIMTRSRLKS